MFPVAFDPDVPGQDDYAIVAFIRMPAEATGVLRKIAESEAHSILCLIKDEIETALTRKASSETLCTSCGEIITGRSKRPRKGLRSFCDKPECKRECRRLGKQDQRSGKRSYRKQEVAPA